MARPSQRIIVGEALTLTNCPNFISLLYIPLGAKFKSPRVLSGDKQGRFMKEALAMLLAFYIQCLLCL